MTPEEKAEYRAKVQQSFYVKQPEVNEVVTVTTAGSPAVLVVTETEDVNLLKPKTQKKTPQK
jgi:hypothetical protein